MNFTVRPKIEDPKVASAEILISGRVVGDIKPVDDSKGGLRWHACMRVETSAWETRLVQGFGPTHEAAIADAFESSRKRAEEYLDELLGLAQAAGYQFKDGHSERR